MQERQLSVSVMYLSPLTSKVYRLVNFFSVICYLYSSVDCLCSQNCFLDRFFKNLSFEIAMSWPACVAVDLPRFTFWLTFLKNLSIMQLGVFFFFMLFLLVIGDIIWPIRVIKDLTL